VAHVLSTPLPVVESMYCDELLEYYEEALRLGRFTEE